MSGLPVPANLGDWMAGVERQLRDLATGNPLNKGAVQNASGDWVPISQLAFGQVAAQDTNPTGVQITGTAGTVGSLPWVGGGPNVTVQVSGGRLRVDLAASLFASGNRCSVFASWSVIAADGPQAGLEYVLPDMSRSIEVQDQSTMGSRGSYSTFGLHTNLPRGLYTVAPRYSIAYSATSGPPFGQVLNRRIAATPY